MTQLFSFSVYPMLNVLHILSIYSRNKCVLNSRSHLYTPKNPHTTHNTYTLINSLSIWLHKNHYHHRISRTKDSPKIYKQSKVEEKKKKTFTSRSKMIYTWGIFHNTPNSIFLSFHYLFCFSSLL